jgi:putative tryptophan/tyrosine transport system substrate-binding protein
MRRREVLRLIAGLSAGALARPRFSLAQAPDRVYRIGIMAGTRQDEVPWPPFFDELSRLGFVERENLHVDGHFSMRDETAAATAAALITNGVDAIVTGGYARTRAAQMATTSIPILTVADDLVLSGLVNSLSHPGGNTTGISILATELDGKRQELLFEIVPGARHIGTLADPNVTRPEQLSALVQQASERGECSIHTASRPEDIIPSIEAAHAAAAQGLNVLATPLFNANQRVIIQHTAALQLPAIYQWPEIAERGGLAAYGPNYNQLYRQHARQLVKLLRGTKPADMPVEQPDKFELVINLKTANAIGITVPQSFLARADEVID